MKNITINYKVFSEKSGNKNIIVLSDLHNYTMKKKIDLVDSILNNSPDLIIIAGDTLQALKYSKGSLSQKKLKDFLHDISEFSPVVLGLGNHDLYGATEETILGYKELENARSGMVFPLNNESIILGDTRIVEFHPRHDAFSPSIQERGNALLQFEEDYEKSDFYVPKDELFNIVICHNPKYCASSFNL